jgi:hypothetical protein
MSEVLHWWSATTKCQSRGLRGAGPRVHLELIDPGFPRLSDLARRGELPPVYGESEDPERLVPILARPVDLMIAVSGDPLRTNCTLVSNGMHGYPTTKRIRLTAIGSRRP